MTRPPKNTVDYFPHQAKGGKTIFILQSRYHNDGYAFWFKMLELLCSTDNHVYYASTPEEMGYLTAYCGVDEETAIGILNMLSGLGAIDKELWDNDKAIWSDNLVNNIADAYRNRVNNLPQKPSILRKKPSNQQVSDVDNPQTILNKTIVKKTKRRVRREYPPLFERLWAIHPVGGKLDAFKAFDKIDLSETDVDYLADSLKKYKATDQWQRRVYPNLSTWLNKGYYESVPKSVWDEIREESDA